MKELTVFENSAFGSVRTVELDGDPWFVGKDVAEALGYTNPRKALIDHVDDEDKEVTKCYTPGGDQDMTIINESGLYSLVLSSKLPTAKQFKRWITSEVIPAIRKNGGYIAGQKELTPDELMAKALLVAQQTLAERDARISELTVQNAIMQPKADYFDELVDRNLLTSFRETAKLLHIKQNTFIRYLLDHKYLYRKQSGKLMVYQKHIDDGLFELKEQFNQKTEWKGTQPLVTPKGRETFRLLLEGTKKED